MHEIRSRGGRVIGVTLADGTRLDAPVVVRGERRVGRPDHRHRPALPVRPIKGQILRLDPRGLPQPAQTVRAITQGSEVYVVPRASGREVVVGATVEEKGFDGSVTADGVYELLRDARRVLPMTAEYALAETTVGWRPGTPDNAPILGPGSLDGLVLATGHYRNGVLLTPVTADVISSLRRHRRARRRGPARSRSTASVPDARPEKVVTYNTTRRMNVWLRPLPGTDVRTGPSELEQECDEGLRERRPREVAGAPPWPTWSRPAQSRRRGGSRWRWTGRWCPAPSTPRPRCTRAPGSRS